MRPTAKIVLILLIILFSAFIVQFFRNLNEAAVFKIKQPVLSSPRMPLTSAKIPDGYAKVLILASDEKVSQLLLSQMKRLFFQTKTNYFVFNLNDAALSSKLIRLSSQDIVVVTCEVIKNLQSIEALTRYVESGGKVVFLFRGNNKELNPLLGIKKIKGFINHNRGIKINKHIFPGLDNIEIKAKPFINSSLLVELDSTCEVLATSTDKVPLIWINHDGKGTVLYFNTSNNFDKINRGLIVQCISYISDYFLSSILNAKIINIDDFPAPISSVKNNVIFSQYHISNEMFYKNIWWSDLYNLEYKYNLKYTAMLIGAYNNKTGALLPEISREDQATLLYFGRKIAESHGEIGIHGYNHMPLVLKDQIDFDHYGYKPWQSTANMDQSLLKLHHNWQQLFGNINYYTYVPPSNIISIAGERAVLTSLPGIRMINSIFAGYEGKGVLYQEFGKDPAFPGIYNMPRFSSGYDNSPEMMWEIYNGIAWWGLFNHFIHPDDILDRNRSNNRTWKQLLGSFTQILSELWRNFNFLRPMTNSEAYTVYREYENLQVFSYLKDNTIEIRYKNAVPPVFHYLRLNGRKISRVLGGDFTLFDRTDSYNYYIIKGNNSTVTILLKDL